MDSQMDGLTEWREGRNQYFPSIPSWGNKTFCGEISQYLKKMFSLLFDSKCIQCNVPSSYAYYGHFIFSFETFKNGYECYPQAEH